MVVTSREPARSLPKHAPLALQASLLIKACLLLKITILTLLLLDCLLGKIAEKEGEYFYIKCKFDAENSNSILLFGQDYFNLYGDIAHCYSPSPRKVIELLLLGILEGIMARAGQKSEGFKVNVTMEQKLRWEEATRERDMTMSQMIREAVEMYIAVMKRQKELDKKQNIR